MRIWVLGIAVCISLALAGCDAGPAGTPTKAEAIASLAKPEPLTPSGAPVALTVAETTRTDNGLQWAASVVKIDEIPGESAKLFGVAGGDPAMNGLQTYVAFFQDPAEGWAIYPIGDFLGYTILSHANGRVDLEIEESTMDGTSGDIGSRKRKIIVQWTQGPNDEVPATVTVTPAAWPPVLVRRGMGG